MTKKLGVDSEEVVATPDVVSTEVVLTEGVEQIKVVYTDESISYFNL